MWVIHDLVWEGFGTGWALTSCCLPAPGGKDKCPGAGGRWKSGVRGQWGQHFTFGSFKECRVGCLSFGAEESRADGVVSNGEL